MVSKKHTVSVPGFYSTMKKTHLGKDGNLMEEDRPAQPHHSKPTTMPEKEPQAENRYKPRINPQSMRNGHSDLNPIKVTILTITQTHNSIVNDFPEESSNVEESNNVETVLSEEVYTSKVLGEEQKSDMESVSREGVNCGSPIQGNNIKKSPRAC